MTALYERGSLRIQPASYFAHPGHNSAVNDNELNRRISVVLSGESVRKLVINPQDLPEQVPDHRVDVQFTFPTDYHLYCLTTSVKPRLFVDFDAEACVIIRDRDAFKRLLQAKAAEELPHSSMTSGSAQYIDPLLPTSGRVFVPLCKYFGYGYQREYRFCWLPPLPAKQLAPVDVEIGSLEGIAELVVL